MFQNCNRKDQYSRFHKNLSMEASNNKSNWRQHGVQSVWCTVAHRDKNYDNKIIRKNFLVYWGKSLIVQTNTIDRRMVENDMRLVELKTVSEQNLSDRYCIFEGWSISKNHKFQWFSFEKSKFWIKLTNPQKWSNCVIR